MDRKLTPFGELLTRSADRHVPLKLFFELTHRCNHRCVHCFITKPGNEISTAGWKKLLDEAAALGGLFLTFTGGEPLLRDDFFDIAAHARELHFAIRIFTNATLIDEAAADRLADILPMEVDISIYGSKPEIHDPITAVPGSFDRLTRAVNLLLERNVNTSLKCIVMRQNLDDYRNVFDLSDSLGLKCRMDPNISPKDNGDASNLVHRIPLADLRELLSDPRILPRYEPEECLNPWCQIGTTELSVAPNGDVIPCIQWRHKAGSVSSSTLGKIWETSPVLNALRDITIKKVPTCDECGDAKWCARCPGIAELEGGFWNQPYQRACETARFLREIQESRED